MFLGSLMKMTRILTHGCTLFLEHCGPRLLLTAILAVPLRLLALSPRSAGNETNVMFVELMHV